MCFFVPLVVDGRLEQSDGGGRDLFVFQRTVERAWIVGAGVSQTDMITPYAGGIFVAIRTRGPCVISRSAGRSSLPVSSWSFSCCHCRQKRNRWANR